MKTASAEPPGKAVAGTGAKPAKPPKTRKPQPAGLPETAGQDSLDFDTRVRALAYRYYEARGCIDGHEAEDWARAEAELKREHAARHEPAAG